MIRRVVLAAAVLLLTAAPAHAAKVTYGSDLALPANLTDSHAEDWAAWPTATTPGSAGGYAVTQAGEVSAVAFRGSILAPTGIPAGFIFHIVVLRPQSDGSVKLMVSSVDVANRLTGIDPQAVTSVDLQQFPERMCVLPGDVVALATSGGYDAQAYPSGVPVQMFSRVPTSSYAVYKKVAGGPSFQVGTTAGFTSAPNTELLMRITVGTGDDARPTCRVGATPTPAATATPAPTTTAPAASGPVTVPAPASSPRVRKNRVKIGITCPGPLACSGRLSLSSRSRAYGSARFALAAGAKANVAITLTKAARKGLKAGHGKVTVKALAVTAAGDKASVRFRIRT